MKLLICDDDISTIDVIQNQTDWDSLGITKVLRAYNGVVAKEIISRERPELVLCDIEMPQCNGIEVLKYVYEEKISTVFTFLTCFESFEYAREAVRYGAKNYLTKPLDLDELNETLKKMVSDATIIRDERERHDTSETREIIALNSFLRNLRDGFYGTNPEKIDATLKREHISLETAEPWRQICLTVNMEEAYKQGWSKELANYSFQYLACEAIADRLDLGFSITDLDDKFYSVTLLVPVKKLSEMTIQQRCQRFVHICMTHMSVWPVCVISDEDMLYSIPETSGKLRRMLHRLRFRSGQVFLEREISEDILNGESIEFDHVVVIGMVKRHDKESYVNYISGFLEKTILGRAGSDRQMALLHHDLLQSFYTLLRDNKIPVHELFKSSEMRDKDYYSERSASDMKVFAEALYDGALAAMEQEKSSSDMISIVKQYIKEHFREDIDRNEVATVAFITPNYLSKRFRSETGMSLREYINELRINEAKRLLLSTRKTVSEVACEVGFENISYFSTVFHKHCEMSPIEWRESAGKNR